MISRIDNFFKEQIKGDIGFKLFLIGIFFLPSALPISGLFLLASLVFSYTKTGTSFISDKWNYPLFISIGIILFSTLNITIFNKPELLSNYKNNLIWINLINWIPIFFLYWGFQIYLKSEKQREYFAKVLLSGSIAVIISFILQKFFNLYGPFKILFNTIIWFQKPITGENGPISGLFSNPNYAGMWLSIIFPFSLYSFNLIKQWSSKKFFLLGLCITISYMIILTGSRNALMGIIISTCFIFSFKKFLYFPIFIVSLLSINKLVDFFLNKDLAILNIFLPDSLIDKLINISINLSPRLQIWQSALTRIHERPFWGWGASTFPFLHLENNEAFQIPNLLIFAQHSHNMPLELAHNFGIPLSIILISTIFLLLIKSWIIIFKRNILGKDIIFQQAWFSSSLIVVISHLTDITFYDGKISILICALFAGLKCIIEESR